MHEMYEDLTEMCETLADELSKTNEKLEKSGGTISAGDIEYIDKLTHAIKSIKTTKAMMEADDEYSGEYSGDYDSDMNMRGGRSNRGYSRRGSYARGRGRGSRAKRDSMGRYSSEMGYSRDDGMIMELRELMEDAPDEKTRMEFQRFIKKMEQM